VAVSVAAIAGLVSAWVVVGRAVDEGVPVAVGEKVGGTATNAAVVAIDRVDIDVVDFVATEAAAGGC
jgi:hypothetical protein